MCQEAVADQIYIRVDEAKYLSLFVPHIRCTAFGPVLQTVLVHPGDSGNPSREPDANIVSVAFDFQKAHRAQLLKHLHLSLHPSLFFPQVALLSWRVLAPVRVALGDDSLLLTAPQGLADAAGQFVARYRFESPQEVCRPVL